MKKPGINEFYDINKFPKDTGITYCALSMPLLNNLQSPEKCYQFEMDLLPKMQVSNVGGVIVYTDSLYLYAPEEAMELKIKYQRMVEDHKAGWLSLIKKNIFVIPSAFTFWSWSQLLLECPKFSHTLIELRKIYENDVLFKKYVELDIEAVGRKVDKYTAGYLLEEILADYFVVKGQVRLQNDYTKDKEQWILNCYQGKPHRSYVYLLQQNFLKLKNGKNVYENCWYDGLNKKLYEFDRLDIESFDFSKSPL